MSRDIDACGLGNIRSNIFLIRFFFSLILKQRRVKKHLYLLEKQCPKLIEISYDDCLVLWKRNANITYRQLQILKKLN
jgi:hypothetical protein